MDCLELTNMRMAGKAHHEWVDVFPIESGDFPAFHVPFLGGVSWKIKHYEYPCNIPPGKDLCSDRHSHVRDLGLSAGPLQTKPPTFGTGDRYRSFHRSIPPGSLT